MLLQELQPHLRFAAALRYEMPYNKKPVRVTDCRIFYVTRDQAKVTIDTQTYTLEPDSLFFCCAGSSYTVDTPAGFSLISLNFDLSRQYDTLTQPISPVRDAGKWDSMTVLKDTVAGSPFLNGHLFLPKASSFLEPLQKVVSDFSAADPLSRQLSDQRLKLLLLELHRAGQMQLPEKVRQVQSYIQNHYAEKITNQALSDLVGYHEYHLNRIFQSSTGMHMHSYLLSVRLQHAKELILNTDLPLHDISEQVGFGNYAHFSSYFKKTYNHSPAQYRKQLRSNI